MAEINCALHRASQFKALQICTINKIMLPIREKAQYLGNEFSITFLAFQPFDFILSEMRNKDRLRRKSFAGSKACRLELERRTKTKTTSIENKQVSFLLGITVQNELT